MQIQTTTITTETMPVQNVNFQITTFEQTTSVFCDCCDTEAKAEKSQLENRGWYLGQREQFCPECND